MKILFCTKPQAPNHFLYIQTIFFKKKILNVLSHFGHSPPSFLEQIVICLVGELLDHMTVLFIYFWGILMVMQIYISTINSWASFSAALAPFAENRYLNGKWKQRPGMLNRRNRVGELSTDKMKNNELNWQSEESRIIMKMTCYPRSSATREETCSIEFSSLMSWANSQPF